MITQTPNRSRHTQRGITMVDMLVAMAVSMLLMVGLLQAYLGTKQVYRVEESTARLMESGTVAMELLSRSVRGGGYWECSSWEAGSVKNHLGTNQRGLHGTDGTSGAPDTLRTLRLVNDTALAVQADVTLPATITVPSGHGLQEDSLVVINNCTKGDIFELDSVTATTLTPDCGTCTESYTTVASVHTVDEIQFYLATGAGGQSALFQNANGAVQEIVEGVEDMQIFYGEDTDGDGTVNRYVTTAAIDALCGSNPDCWLRVVSVRISLLLRTLDDNITQQPQTYTYNGADVTATDNRLRRVFTSIISLRNHRI
jgi:type IV pilus assembly protein PilW